MIASAFSLYLYLLVLKNQVTSVIRYAVLLVSMLF